MGHFEQSCSQCSVVPCLGSAEKESLFFHPRRVLGEFFRGMRKVPSFLFFLWAIAGQPTLSPPKPQHERTEKKSNSTRVLVWNY